MSSQNPPTNQKNEQMQIFNSQNEQSSSKFSNLPLSKAEINKNSIDSYYTYTRIVADDDNGNQFTDQQYKNYIETVARHRNENRLYAHWVNSQNLECKAIGPETKCFCGCRYKQHNVDQIGINNSDDLNQKIKIKCKVKGCKCGNFTFAPTIGPNNFAKCFCKHDAELHRTPGKKCQKSPNFCNCQKYSPTLICDCQEPANLHSTKIENRQMRAKLSKRTDFGEEFGLAHAPDFGGGRIPVGALYKGLGGLTGHKSLMSGQSRKLMEDAGILPVTAPVRAAGSGAHNEMINLYKNLE